MMMINLVKRRFCMLYFYCKDMNMQLALITQPQSSVCLNYTRFEVISYCTAY